SRYAVAASRASGIWVGMKIVADVADGVWTVDGSAGQIDIAVPELEWDGRPWTYQRERQTPMLIPPASVAAEEQLYGPRWAMRRCGSGLDTVLVVEEKTEFVESAVRDAMYRLSAAPEVIGSADQHGSPLVPVFGELTAGALAGPLRRVLSARPEVADRLTPP